MAKKALIDRVNEIGAALDARYDELIEATEQHKQALVAFYDSECDLEEAKREVWARHPDPKVLGSNEEARRMKVAELTAHVVEAHNAAEKASRQASHVVSLARLRVDAARDQLRVLEVLKDLE